MLPEAAAIRQDGRGRRLVVVSNRIADGLPNAASSGGLAVGIQAALKTNGGIWFGWSGEVREDPEAEPALTRSGNVTYAKVDLRRQDYEEYYNGFANRVLWPLFHYRPDLVDFRRDDLAGYLRVNRQFAEQLAPLLQPNDLVWVHDYHLMALGEELRRVGVEHPLGFFLHTPFPPRELVRLLPNHAALMRAMCAFDLVGFQTESDLEGIRLLSRARDGRPRARPQWDRRERAPAARRRLPDRHRCRRGRHPGGAIGRQPSRQAAL